MSNSYSIQQLAEFLPECEFYFFSPEEKIKKILIDSRQFISATNTLFVALTSYRNNGHKYISELYEKGLKNFIVTEKPNLSLYPNGNFIVVKDSQIAIQKIAQKHREKFTIPVIGITGSNGKTIVKEWLYQLLSPEFNIVKSPKSFNSQIGVPLSVWEISEEHTLGIFEAGISQPKEMDQLQKIIQPNIGVVTNIKTAHSENFVNIQEIANEKTKLFAQTNTIIFCKDYPELNALNSKENFSWSQRGNAVLMVNKVEKKQGSTQIKGIFNNTFIEIEIPFTDDASIENAITCWCVLLYLKYDNSIINDRFSNLQSVAMRLQLKEGINSCSIINDYYNSDLDSLEIALQYLKNQKRNSKKTLILSDILQSVKNPEQFYSSLNNLIVTNGIEKLICIGPELTKRKLEFKTEEKVFYETTQEFLDKTLPEYFWNETILIKGSRKFEFEQVARFLEEKSHETVLEINLENLIHNVNYYKNLLEPNTKIMAMVKAFSYGSGTFEIASSLQFQNINYLAVAYTDEGVELRKKGIHLPIMVMNPSEDSFEALFRNNLEPEIYSFRILDSFSRALKNHFPYNKKFPIHLKINTGMNRLGFDLDEIDKLCNRINDVKQIKIASVFSHLVASDNQNLKDFTQQQIKEFDRVCTQIKNEIGDDFLRHLSNTSGIKNYSDASFEMVRLGIGMYGIGNSEEERKNLLPVGRLKTTINQIRRLKKEQTVGYNRAGILYRDSLIATLPIGYADGFSRKLGNGVGKIFINGKLAPTIGNICMDMTMVDVTEIDCNEGDEVIVFGPEYPIYDLAKNMDTIPYEVLTMISQRVKRVFLKE
jgi:Alr-MurF fusion protein